MANKKAELTVKKTYLELLYMTPISVTATELAEFFMRESKIKVELWSEMNVLELELPNQNTVDFEPLDLKFSVPSDAAFVKNRSINTIFLINMVNEDLDFLLPSFEKMIDNFSGFVCSDSADFKPVYAGSLEKTN